MDIMHDFCKFYGFSQDPFDDLPNNRFFFPSASHNEALLSMLYGINSRKGLIVILGERGGGKTTLALQLMSALDPKTRTIYFPTSNLPFNKILKEILQELGLSPEGKTKGEKLHELNYHLISCLERDENVAVILDEVQDIGADVIEELRLLANLETSTAKLLQIVFIGQPELMDKLRSNALRQIKQRIVINYEIKPLGEDEAVLYVDHRLKSVGSDSSFIFTGKALSIVCRHAKGNPRLLNVICRNALSLGYRLSEKRISPSTVKKILPHKVILSDEEVMKKTHRYLPRYAPIAVSAVVILALFLLFSVNYPSLFPFHLPLMNHPAAADSDKGQVRLPDGKKVLPERREADSLQPVTMNTTHPLATREISAPPPIVLPVDEPEIQIREIIKARRGQTLHSLADNYYKGSDETFIDYILKLNPEITNPNLIHINQTIRIPEITKSLLTIKCSNNLYQAHLKTFANLKKAEQYKHDVIKPDKEIKILPLPVSSEETWYRVVVGPFKDRSAASRYIGEINLL